MRHGQMIMTPGCLLFTEVLHSFLPLILHLFPSLDTQVPTQSTTWPWDIYVTDSFFQLVTELRTFASSVTILSHPTSSGSVLWIMDSTFGTQERPFIKSERKRIDDWFRSTKSLSKRQRTTQTCIDRPTCTHTCTHAQTHTELCRGDGDWQTHTELCTGDGELLFQEDTLETSFGQVMMRWPKTSLGVLISCLSRSHAPLPALPFVRHTGSGWKVAHGTVIGRNEVRSPISRKNSSLQALCNL